MTAQDTPHIVDILTYPVKGLKPQHFESIDVRANETLADDRRWEIENGPGRFDANAPKHLPKINFLMLMRNERLAALETEYSDDTTLVIKRGGKQVTKGQLNTKIGRQMIEQFLAAYMKDDLRGTPKIVSADGHSFSDVALKCVHIINLATVRELERVAGKPINPLRFRANIYIDHLPAWAEFDLVGQPFSLGSTLLQGEDRTIRCAATDVDPTTTERDLAVPALLERTWGHSDFGIYATIKENGRLAVGDALASQP